MWQGRSSSTTPLHDGPLTVEAETFWRSELSRLPSPPHHLRRRPSGSRRRAKRAWHPCDETACKSVFSIAGSRPFTITRRRRAAAPLLESANRKHRPRRPARPSSSVGTATGDRDIAGTVDLALALVGQPVEGERPPGSVLLEPAGGQLPHVFCSSARISRVSAFSVRLSQRR
jgi:hypothetical protein